MLLVAPGRTTSNKKLLQILLASGSHRSESPPAHLQQQLISLLRSGKSHPSAKGKEEHAVLVFRGPKVLKRATWSVRSLRSLRS